MYKYNLFFFSVDRTFWYKKVKSITLWRITYKNEYERAAKAVFTIPFRNCKKADELDSILFRKNGGQTNGSSSYIVKYKKEIYGA